MIPWSSLRMASKPLFTGLRTNLGNSLVRQMSGGGHEKMPITPSRWQWKKVKDLLHFYAMAGLIPVGALLFYTNVFIGPATLQPIPDGYVPKHWEYHKHPITRFLAKYFYTNPQQEYEKYMHLLYEEDEKMKIRLLEKKIKKLMSDRGDYAAYYYKPIDGKQHRIVQKDTIDIADASGVNRPY